MLISDRAKFLVKNCFEGGGCFHATIYIEKARVLRSNLTNVSPVLSVEISGVPLRSVVLPRKS